ncbi:MAG: glycosyltransferase family 9 protein [Bacteriovoracaceae bacterium]|nr:glycosyltransferase family 9 protein [Bacteriovoracaceae bacterium]
MNILINRTDAIGDTLLSTPLARLIKDKEKSAHITFLVSPRSGDLINLCVGVDEVLIYDPAWPLFKKITFLKSIFENSKWDSYFHLGGSFLPSFFAFFFRVKNRGGLRSKIFSFLFLNKGVRQSRSTVVMHECEYNMALAAPFNYHFSGRHLDKYRPTLKIDSSLAQSIRKEELIPIDKKIIIVHPGMSGHTLNWSSRNYGRLLHRLYNKFGDDFYYLVSFTPSDEPYLMGLRDYVSQDSQLNKSVHFFDGSKKGLIHYAHLLSQANLFIGPSTGTTHMANAMNIPLVALYSPIKVQSSLRWGPYKNDDMVEVLVPDVVCGEINSCAGASCPYYECMSKIEVQEVYKACSGLIEKFQ